MFIHFLYFLNILMFYTKALSIKLLIFILNLFLSAIIIVKLLIKEYFAELIYIHSIFYKKFLARIIDEIRVIT